MEQTNLGYTQPLYILPFDHRTGLYREFGWAEPLTGEQIEVMKRHRGIIYDGLKRSLGLGIPKEHIGVLTDDIFGIEVLNEASREGFITILTTEKSGTPFFDFEHGEKWKEMISAMQPTFTKALVRYNPEGNNEDNQKSLANLKLLSDFSHENGYKFLVEPLVPGTEAQLAGIGDDKKRYDAELRPALTAQMIKEFQAYSVEPDIWKIEGFENESSYEKVVSQARSGGRNNVGIISLGRNETDKTVSTWLHAGSHVTGVIGFAVGRTIFLDSLKQLMAGEISEEEASSHIAEKFFYFYKIFTQKT
jgi:5-dehydro-2-deoxygluconokinase